MHIINDINADAIK